MVANLGFDPIWFTILCGACKRAFSLLQWGLLFLSGVAPEGVDVTTTYRGVIPFIALQVLGMLVIFNWQAIVTWLREACG